jgi:hypothetical protein
MPRNAQPNGNRSAHYWRLRRKLLVLLDEAETFWGGDLTGDDLIDGGDLVEWFAEWLPKVQSASPRYRRRAS